MTYVIRIHGVAGYGPGASVYQNYVGRYVKYYNPDGKGGRGEVQATPHKRYALQFDSQKEAWELWTKQSVVLPTRPDGKPNKPLTAFTVMIEPFEDEPGA